MNSWLSKMLVAFYWNLLFGTHDSSITRLTYGASPAIYLLTWFKQLWQRFILGQVNHPLIVLWFLWFSLAAQLYRPFAEAIRGVGLECHKLQSILHVGPIKWNIAKYGIQLFEQLLGFVLTLIWSGGGKNLPPDQSFGCRSITAGIFGNALATLPALWIVV